jgi:hypothetical protein
MFTLKILRKSYVQSVRCMQSHWMVNHTPDMNSPVTLALNEFAKSVVHSHLLNAVNIQSLTRA